MREPGASEIPLRELQGPLVSLQSVYTWAAVCLLITEGYGELSRTPHVGVRTNPPALDPQVHLTLPFSSTLVHPRSRSLAPLRATCAPSVSSAFRLLLR